MSQKYLESFKRRHLGINPDSLTTMLDEIGADSLDQLVTETVPDNIRMNRKLDIPEAMTEHEYLSHVHEIAKMNRPHRSLIGRGYYDTITPSVILRNIFHNPGWYTQYTPYQAEISQGRLEALLNFQTVISDLTSLPVANASLLDEATAAAESMAMMEAIRNKKRKNDPAKKFFVDNYVFDQTVDVMESRALPLGIELVKGDYRTIQLGDDFIGVLLQFPSADGVVKDYRTFVENCKSKELLVCVAADIMALTLLTPPGEWGADIVVGNTQRLGVPMGHGGPHAAYFATKEEYKRLLPGRIIGVSVDRLGNPALRMALQTREQHIKREKATSNICTAQALLAVMAGMYAVYHGAEGITNIAHRIASYTSTLADSLLNLGLEVSDHPRFDTITITMSGEDKDRLKDLSMKSEYNFHYDIDSVSLSLDEKTNDTELKELIDLFSLLSGKSTNDSGKSVPDYGDLARTTPFMEHSTFSIYHTETEMMRYIKSLENKDLSLVHSMIPLGSCTMKLNAASQLIPVTWPEFSAVHPFAPKDQVLGYYEIFEKLSAYLCDITGLTACSLQPNSGAQGELTGLLTIRAYHHDRGDTHRNVAIIPSSAHGTNPASAVMAGMKVVVVKCDDHGNIDVDDLLIKANEHKDNLSALLVTYPSTHGVFEEEIVDICNAIHDNGGLVYMDGANMNAQVGLTNPGIIGADVCHLNLHKTFAIPHGGGGPGMGPICVNENLAPYLPGHSSVDMGSEKSIKAVSAAPWGSSSILLISYGYIRMLGAEGLTKSSQIAILNANYLKTKLEKHYPVLYTGKMNKAAHELILDLRQFKPLKISAEDVAKRLIDYGFHAPTLSFPVPGTIMIEPTESESKAELDKFCEAMIAIKNEIDDVANGKADETNNVLRNSPHTIHEVTSDEWNHPYTRRKAAYPVEYLRLRPKFWADVARVDNAHGDRNFICTCPPIESYVETEA